MTINRTLNVAVTFNCTHDAKTGAYGGTASYAQTSCDPSDMGTVVESNGNIKLDRAAHYDPSVYNQAVDIVLTLATPANVSPDGTTTPVRWALANGGGVTIQAPRGGTAAEIGVTTSPGNPNVLTLSDKDDDDKEYQYKPAVELTAVNNYYISLDPKIVNRPTNTNK
jgi:hypothetical protein